jgi:hypothetical protein
MKKITFFIISIYLACNLSAQNSWVNLDSLYQPLPASFHIFKSIDSIEGKPNVMYYAIADLKDKNLNFTVDTSRDRRLTPSQFYEKNNFPLLVVNGSFFSFATNRNLNVVVKNGHIVSYNEHSIPGRAKDTLTYIHPFVSAIGITRNRTADVAYIYSDSSKKFLYASQMPVPVIHDSVSFVPWKYVHGSTSGKLNNSEDAIYGFKKWKVKTAIGGGPVLVQDGKVDISNNEERKFAGNQKYNPEPRTAIGYTKDNKIIIFVCEGRSANAAGLSLPALASIMKDLGCKEAMNLDGGGSSCMLINGKITNTPSSKGVQRQVPSVFLIERK